MVASKKQNFSRAHLDALMDRALEENGALIIRRPGQKDLAVISAERLRSMDTTDYLLASPKNRQRLLGALRDARAGKGRKVDLQQLRKRLHSK